MQVKRSTAGLPKPGIWPAQVVAYLLALSMVALLFRASRNGDRLIAGGLAAMWLWTGVAYHWLYFSSINNAALLFGALFVLQGAAFAFAGIVRGHLRFGRPAGIRAWVGWAFVGYAAVLYPLLGLWLGHAPREVPAFGVTPCPVTIFSFGLLLLTTAPFSRWLLLLSGLATVLLTEGERRRPRRPAAALS